MDKFSKEYFQAQGRKGGKSRTAKLTKARRSAIAKKAARARWGKKGAK